MRIHLPYFFLPVARVPIRIMTASKQHMTARFRDKGKRGVQALPRMMVRRASTP